MAPKHPQHPRVCAWRGGGAGAHRSIPVPASTSCLLGKVAPRGVEHVSQCLLMPCGGVDAEVCASMSTPKGRGLGGSRGATEALGASPRGHRKVPCLAGSLELLSPLSLLARLRLVAERAESAVNTCASL